MIDMTGKIIWTRETTENSIKIQRDHVNQGIFLLKIRSNDYQSTHKIILE